MKSTLGAETKSLTRPPLKPLKKHEGKKFTVSIGDWGVKTYLVFAESKDEAKDIAIAETNREGKTKVREVTNCKKYQ